MLDGFCRLCGEKKELQDSHFLSKGFYKRMYKQTNEESLKFTPTKYFKTSKQITAHLLCSDCEKRFNNGGEAWILKNYPQNDGSFPILERLKEQQPYEETKDSQIYQVSASSKIDLQKLSYFAISVFWRSSVHEWDLWGVKRQLNLGSYQERFRQYLHEGAVFPESAMLFITVSPNKDFEDGALFPSTYETQPFHRHSFSIPRINFILFCGKQVPKELLNACAIHNRVIVLSETAQQRVWSNLSTIPRDPKL